jgi:uncharacterized protein (DUF58 family)
MDIRQELHKAPLFQNLELLAQEVVEGFISGIHKSPFHGFSAEFAEHTIYTPGESTRHIDWKLFAKTDMLYTKKYEEETNLRCHFILDGSASMFYPPVATPSLDNLNKLGFGVLAIAALMGLLKKQRDAVGLSIYADTYQYYAPEKGSERHHRMVLEALKRISLEKKPETHTRTYTFLHQIAEKIHRRSLIFLFTDLLDPESDADQLFQALRHLKYNKHQVVLFHLSDAKTELDLDFDDTPKRFLDVETGKHLDVHAHRVRESYTKHVTDYFRGISLQCAKYGIQYVPVDIGQGFAQVMNTYLVERQKFR